MNARNDYAKKNHTRGNSRNTNRRKVTNKQGVPGWVWLLAGLSIGLFIAFLISISDQKSTGKPIFNLEKSAPQKHNDRERTKVPPKSDTRSGGVKFDFYHILPEMEVAIPKDEIKAGAKNSEIDPIQYIIQVGSFRNSADAESRRAELFLLNFKPSLQTVTIDGNQSWHRVRLGPFIDRRKLDLAQRRLQNSDIDFITLKERK